MRHLRNGTKRRNAGSRVRYGISGGRRFGELSSQCLEMVIKIDEWTIPRSDYVPNLVEFYPEALVPVNLQVKNFFAINNPFVG